MLMAAISRWTLAFFGAALGFLVCALGLMAAGIGYPEAALLAPQTLIVVHLVVLGWLTLLMTGALLQFLPVLVGGALRFAGLAPIVLGLIVSGLILLPMGFAVMDGWAQVPPETLPLGGLLLLTGLSLAAVILFSTLLNAKSLPLPAGFVAIALMSVLVTALLGETLASAIAGLFGGDFAAAIITHGVPLHAGFGLGGWLTLAAMGVSYRLVSMFLVAPERKGLLSRLVFWCALVAVAGLALALGMLLAVNADWPLALGVAGLAGLGALAAYAGDIVALYRSRRRRELELHMAAAMVAFAALPVGGLWLVGASWAGNEAGIAAAVYLLALGWLGGLGLAMLYKIVPFLTWLECFAPLMGRKPTPRVQDLVAEPRARLAFLAYFAAVLGAALALQCGLPLVFRAAALCQLLAVSWLILQFYRARRLADLPAPWHDHPRPRLLVPRQRSFL
ncbi:hypothetical protein [Devosia sp. 63-57]|uniref:hypothetical protein n=1 Tax=Devosia sp. 63-57 TaxID=1895751 RepID=UPI00086B6696|nr:hypothetical protein [Devosia sp. 63-57]ODT51296.1 MAG: hypothetical protein ABS74_01070 [Pelagibacterium sp. SCN 63-126]ODU86587.1 MAG: hypothetical protein ABT14_08085 [Pelagibacterium sp. SCN 63-17]OJX41760.1 MAG: hypothetical protein BGO80_09205 [Devosia sp. 63-57]